LFSRKYGAFGYVVTINYTLILLGMALFLSTLYLIISNLVKQILLLRYTSLDLIFRLKHLEIDPLMMSRASILGFISLAFTVLTLVLGLIMTKTSIKNKKLGIIGYPTLFFLYQYFWILSIIQFIGGKSVKWR
jgi:hypothetical protein